MSTAYADPTDTVGMGADGSATRAKSEAKKGWRAIGRSIAAGCKYVGHQTVRAAKATGRGISWTAKKVGFGAKWTLGAAGVVTFGAVRIVLNVLAALLVLVVGLVLALLVLVVFLLALLEHGVNKFLIRPFKWMTFTPERREREGNSFAMYFEDEKFWTAAVKDTYERFMREDDGPGSPSRYADDGPDYTREHFIPESLSLDMAEPKKTEHSAQFKAHVDEIIDADADKPDDRFPGTDTIVGYKGEPMQVFEHEIGDFEKFFAGINTSTPHFEQDFSQFQDLEELQRFYSYSADMCRNSGQLHESSYWEGRMQALKHFRERPDLLDASGTIWAMVYTRYRGLQSEYSLKYLRAGFSDEVEARKKARDRTRTATKKTTSSSNK